MGGTLCFGSPVSSVVFKLLACVVACTHASQLQAQLAINPSLPFSPPSNSSRILNEETGSKTHHDTATLKGMLVDWRSDDFAFKEGSDVFSPKDLIELPRPGAGIANPKGDLALVSVSTYSFADKKNHKSIWLVSLESNSTASFPSNSLEIPLPNGGDAFWLDDRTIGHVVAPKSSTSSSSSSENQSIAGGHELYAIPVSLSSSSSQPILISVTSSPKRAGSFPPGISPANFRHIPSTKCLVFSAYVFADGRLDTVLEQNEAYENRGNSALVYDETYERHWDTWTGPKRSKLFAVELSKDAGEKWVLGSNYAAPLRDLKHDVPVEPFGGTDDFSVSDTHLVYTTKDPEFPAALHTRQNIYLVDLQGSSVPRTLTSGKQGATHSPTFSHAGHLVAWTELAQDGYESDRAKIVVYNLKSDKRAVLTETWEYSAGDLTFTKDDTALLLIAGHDARTKLFKLEVPQNVLDGSVQQDEKFEGIPRPLTQEGSVSAVQELPGGQILFTRSSLTSPNELSVLSSSSTDKGTITQLTNFTTPHLRSKSLSPGESFYFHGAADKLVQGWILKPPHFDSPDGSERVKGKAKSVPVVLLIHGGPQSAWEDGWSTRWNPNVFAQQGYFVVAINPTGSTSFGQQFTDAITKDWGGKPFVDLQKGWKYVLDKYPEIDPERAVAAGASWGGYAINWIQGHPEYGFDFKALVGHDGVFDTRYNGYSTDELFFFNHDFGGPPWDPKAKPIVDKFNPADFILNWSTPQLIIHGSRDYRLPETEGIGVWHALQQRGIPSRLVVFPDENHWVLNHGNSLKWHYEVFRWFDKYVGEKASKKDG